MLDDKSISSRSLSTSKPSREEIDRPRQVNTVRFAGASITSPPFSRRIRRNFQISTRFPPRRIPFSNLLNHPNVLSLSLSPSSLRSKYRKDRDRVDNLFRENNKIFPSEYLTLWNIVCLFSKGCLAIPCTF